jgi:hypothetical protein
MWYPFVIPALGRLRKENWKFQASLISIARPYLQRRKDNTKLLAKL